MSSQQSTLNQVHELRPGNKAKSRGPVLSDGARLGDLMDFDEREVAMRVLSDPEIYKLEMDRIFLRSWVGVGHTSEIPKAGDFVLRYIGQEPVIVTRAADGTVSVVLNVCAHRGMEVCWAERGNQANFKCPYHGWVFDAKGKLLGAPFEKDMYPGWDKSKYALRAARVAVRHGLIFANFDLDAPSFEDYAGGLAWYIDRVMENTEWEVTGTPQHIMIPMNWKTFIDQLAGDAYHAATLHHSLMEMGVQSPEPTYLDHVKVTLPPTGHSVFTFNPQNPPADDPYTFNGRALFNVLFPTTGVIGGGDLETVQRDISVRSASMLMNVPRAHDVLEIWSIGLVPKGSSDEDKRKVTRMSAVGNGFVLIDDSQQGPSMQRMASTPLGRQQPMRYFSRGGTHHPNSWPGPGTAHAGFSKDETSWEFWTHWYDAVAGQDA